MTQQNLATTTISGTGRQRKRHVQLSLHPMSLMTMLCVGVFLVAATISVFGDSYGVTASVPGPIPTQPAIIASPSDGQHTTSADTTFSGSCPDATYVTLFINGSAVGSAWCSSQTFSIITTLPAGTSTAQAQDYNSLDQAGPSSPAITVTYDPPVTPPVPNPTPTPAPTPAPRVNAPVNLQITNTTPSPAATLPLQIVLPIYGYQVYAVGQAAPLSFTIAGGRGPYSVLVDWRDGHRSTFVQQQAGPVSLSHRYAAGSRELMSYEVQIRVIDADGQTVISQKPILVRGYIVATSGSTKKTNTPFQQFAAGLHNWLWLIWPGYLIVGLMLLSFYLGERREHEADRKAMLHRHKHA